MADCSFGLALCTENKCFPTLYYLLVGFTILGIPLSDTSKSMIERKTKGCPLIIKLLLSLWLLLRTIYNYYKYWLLNIVAILLFHRGDLVSLITFEGTILDQVVSCFKWKIYHSYFNVLCMYILRI